MRYFAVYYTGEDKYGNQAYGCSGGESMTYPNLRESVNHITKVANLKNAAITNIIELSKADFDEFKR